MLLLKFPLEFWIVAGWYQSPACALPISRSLVEAEAVAFVWPNDSAHPLSQTRLHVCALRLLILP